MSKITYSLCVKLILLKNLETSSIYVISHAGRSIKTLSVVWTLKIDSMPLQSTLIARHTGITFTMRDERRETK